jgi:hypothetical protein
MRLAGGSSRLPAIADGMTEIGSQDFPVATRIIPPRGLLLSAIRKSEIDTSRFGEALRK